jgi:hypothetical protein
MDENKKLGEEQLKEVAGGNFLGLVCDFTPTGETKDDGMWRELRPLRELSEKDLDAVAGGWSQNRYDPNVCKASLGRTRYECVGYLSSCWCDHYSMDGLSKRCPYTNAPIFRHKCAMGAFDYEGYVEGYPYSP